MKAAQYDCEFAMESTEDTAAGPSSHVGAEEPEEEAEKDWSITYPSNWPVATPGENEDEGVVNEAEWLPSLGKLGLALEGCPATHEADTATDPATLLQKWPMECINGSEISIFMAKRWPYAKNYIEYWYNVDSILPEDFVKLTEDSDWNHHMAVAVAMLYGWFPAKLLCTKCGGTMKI